MKSIAVALIYSIFAIPISGFGQAAPISPHDISNINADKKSATCIFCHESSEDDPVANAEPLWNRESTLVSYIVYNSKTMKAVVDQPDGTSKLCLSCHDGTVAADNLGAPQNGSRTGSWLSLGTDLSDDHPISFIFDSALARARRGLHDPRNRGSGLGGTIDQDLLIDHKMQCTSCHSMHNKAGIKGNLIMSNRRSALCLTCHNK